MAPDSTCKRIVATYTDHTCGTGDSLYRTEDGRVWRTSLGNYVEPYHGGRGGWKRGDRICEDTRIHAAASQDQKR